MILKVLLFLFGMEETDTGDFPSMPSLIKPHVHMKNFNEVMFKIKNLMDGGSKFLQVIADFDRTLTKDNINGVPNKSSFFIFEHCSDLPEAFRKQSRLLCDKYRPIEIAPNLSVEEKVPHMVEWWKQSEGLVCGLPIEKSTIDKAVSEANVEFRDGSDVMFKKLHENSVPILVFSAGLGDVITSVLRHRSFNYPNVHVISNFFEFDGPVIKGYLGPPIHVFNKNEQVVKSSKYFHEVRDRKNVLLMGDSLGDANMAEGVPDQSTVLKIGFLTSNHNDEYLPQYLEKFDIVVVDDQTMEIPMEILNSVF